MTTFLLNGWAAGPEAWMLTTFQRDWTFDYLEQMDGLPEKTMSDFDEVILVGFSMGSLTALRLLCRYPEKVRGLVLVSATPRMMEERVDSVGQSIKSWEGFSLRRMEALRIGTEMAFRDDPSPLYAPANLRRGLEFLMETDLRGDLEALVSRSDSPVRNLPVAIFHSERDGIVRPSSARYLQKLFPRASITWVPGNEHVLPVRIPELISEAVEGIQCGVKIKEAG